MKINLVHDSDLPGSFVIHAESPEEVFILRTFCADKRALIIDSYGGNIREGEFSVLIRKKTEETAE